LPNTNIQRKTHTHTHTHAYTHAIAQIINYVRSVAFEAAGNEDAL